MLRLHFILNLIISLYLIILNVSGRKFQIQKATL